jgi:hypothetical protein
MMEFLTHRSARLGLSVIIFVASLFAVRLIRFLDFETTGTLQYLDRTLSDFYAGWQARKSDQLHIVDLDLTLSDRDPNIKQACSRLLDSLSTYRARVIVVDLFFDPYIDTVGQAQLLQIAQRRQNIVFGFAFRQQPNAALVEQLTKLNRHAVAYEAETKPLVQQWPDRNLRGVELPLGGLTEVAANLGFVDIFPERNGRIQYYPLFQRFGRGDSVFAGLSTQAFRLWIETGNNNGDAQPWRLENYFEHFNSQGLAWRKEDGRLRIHRIAPPIETDCAWADIRDRKVNPAIFAGKMVLIVNSPTEGDGPLDEANYPMWGYPTSVISELIEQNSETDWMVWPMLMALFGGWIYMKLWPSPLNNRLVFYGKWFWLGAGVIVYGLPLLLSGQNLIRNSPLSIALLLATALLAFELVEWQVRRLPEIEFLELHLVLKETAGAAQISIQQAPVRLGKRSIIDLPEEKVKIWRQYQQPSCIEDLPKMRALGESLYEFLMADEVGTVFESSLEKAVSANKILRLRLRNDNDSFANLPFEILRHAVKDYGYLGLHNHLSIVRDRTADPNPELQWTFPIRLLLLLASPAGNGYLPLDVQTEKNKIIHSTRLLQRRGWLQMQVIDRVTSAKLESLPPNSFDIIHFVGHALIDAATQSNCLVFEDAAGNEDLIDAERLGQRLRQINPRLIILNACATGEGVEKGVFVNIGRELQRTTGAAVIAQQFSTSDLGGIILSDAFYQNFAMTLSPELALNRARPLIAANGDTLPSDWASPVYFTR